MKLFILLFIGLLAGCSTYLGAGLSEKGTASFMDDKDNGYENIIFTLRLERELNKDITGECVHMSSFLANDSGINMCSVILKVH